MKNTLLLNYKLDFDKTEQAVAVELNRVKRPMYYHELFCSCGVRSSSNEVYSSNTDPKEKFRQYFADCKRSNVVFISGGLIALRHWFPTEQKTLFSPEPYDQKIVGNCSISWNAGYEIAKREAYMKDWFSDAFTSRRLERRKRGSIVEFHVRNFFENNYNEFFINPSNHNKYNLPAEDDFCLRFPISKEKMITLKIDVKSFSESEQKDGIIRNPKDDIVYLFADIDNNEMITMYGIGKGNYLKEIGIKERSLMIIRNNYLFSVDKLIVMLNIARRGMDYMDILNNIKIFK